MLMAKVTIVIHDTKDGVRVRWKDLPCPIHDKPFDRMTAAERFALELWKSITAREMTREDFMKHTKCPGHS